MMYSKDGHYFYPGYHFCFYSGKHREAERDYTEAIAWCEEQFGRRGFNPNKARRTASMYPPERWMAADYCILIRDSHDAFEFRMRWT